MIHGELRGSVLYTLELIVRTATPLDASALRLFFFFLSFWLIHIVLCLCRKHLLDPTIDYKVGSGRLFSSRDVGWKFSMLHTGFQVSIMVNSEPFFFFIDINLFKSQFKVQFMHTVIWLHLFFYYENVCFLIFSLEH